MPFVIMTGISEKQSGRGMHLFSVAGNSKARGGFLSPEIHLEGNS
jgi:hypothetical protein